LLKLNYLTEHEQIYIPRIDVYKYRQRQLEITEAHGGSIAEAKPTQQEEEHANLTRTNEDYKGCITWMK